MPTYLGKGVAYLSPGHRVMENGGCTKSSPYWAARHKRPSTVQSSRFCFHRTVASARAVRVDSVNWGRAEASAKKLERPANVSCLNLRACPQTLRLVSSASPFPICPKGGSGLVRFSGYDGDDWLVGGNAETDRNGCPHRGMIGLPSSLTSLGLTEFKFKQLQAINLIREEQENASQELAYSARPFVLFGIPLRRPPKDHPTYKQIRGYASTRQASTI